MNHCVSIAFFGLPIIFHFRENAHHHLKSNKWGNKPKSNWLQYLSWQNNHHPSCNLTRGLLIMWRMFASISYSLLLQSYSICGKSCWQKDVTGENVLKWNNRGKNARSKASLMPRRPWQPASYLNHRGATIITFLIHSLQPVGRC